MTKADERELQERFEAELFSETKVVPRYNVAPTQSVLVVLNDQGKRVIKSVRWGLIPSWTKDLKAMKPMINARAETIAEKPFFKGCLKSRRCLIPADGFYEWKADPDSGKKIPTYIYLKGQPVFAFAGMYDKWEAPDGEVIYSCTIITRAANPFMKPIHDRMPAILTSREAEDAWLDPEPSDVTKLLAIVEQAEKAKLDCHQVSTAVNTVKTDKEICIVKA